MKKVFIGFCVALFLIMGLSQSSMAFSVSADLDIEDLLFEGNFQFDYDGVYSVYGISYPLNALGYLEVFNNGDKLGDLSLNAQKNLPVGGWDGTYFGHWAFDPIGEGDDSEIGILSDLSQFGEGMLGFTLLNFNDALGMTEEIPRIVGSLEGNHFNGSPVPVPATLLLLGSGLIGLVGLRRRS